MCSKQLYEPDSIKKTPLKRKYLLDVDAQMDLFCTMFTKNVWTPMNVWGKVKMITMLVEVPNVRIPLVPSHVCVPMGIPLTGIWPFVFNLPQGVVGQVVHLVVTPEDPLLVLTVNVPRDIRYIIPLYIPSITA